MLVSVHPETTQCHSEPFDGLRIDSAKNLSDPSNNEILRRQAPQNDSPKQDFRMDTSYTYSLKLIPLT